MIQVGVFSPIPAFRAGLSALLSGDPEIRVAASAPTLTNGEELPSEVQVAAATPGGVLVEEMRLHPQLSWLLVGDVEEWGEEIAFLREGMPEPETAGLARNAWGWGVVAAETTAEALQAAVRGVTQGMVVFSSSNVAAAATQVGNAKAAGDEVSPAGGDDGTVEPLTPRESEVLRLLAQGLTNKQIALALHISEHTVKFHVSTIYGKLGASSRADAVRKGALQGWAPL
jgi:DNA-binding CsgD family transcriptional regulator